MILAGATRIELATSGVTGFFEFNDFNNFACLLYQIVVKCVESWGASAPHTHLFSFGKGSGKATVT
jgi:hypothetical protein